METESWYYINNCNNSAQDNQRIHPNNHNQERGNFVYLLEFCAWLCSFIFLLVNGTNNAPVVKSGQYDVRTLSGIVMGSVSFTASGASSLARTV